MKQSKTPVVKGFFLSCLINTFQSIRLASLRMLFDVGICVCIPAENRCRRQCVSSTRELCRGGNLSVLQESFAAFKVFAAINL